MSARHGGDATAEAALLAAAARGDQRAATALYDAYADALYGYGLTRLRNPELAEELVQRVMEKLWRRAETYDTARGPVRAFVFAIARTSVVDIQRRTGRDPRPVGDIPEMAEPVDDAADRVLLAASMRTALERLSADHRRVLELAYTRGLTQRQVAGILELPLGTVKSRTYYALRALRLACEELGVTR